EPRAGIAPVLGGEFEVPVVRPMRSRMRPWSYASGSSPWSLQVQSSRARGGDRVFPEDLGRHRREEAGRRGEDRGEGRGTARARDAASTIGAPSTDAAELRREVDEGAQH